MQARRTRTPSDLENPNSPLDNAVSIVEPAVSERLRVFTPQKAAEWISTVPESGAHRNRIASARIFGLVRTGRLEITLTPMGYWICFPEWTDRLRVRAFMHCDLFRRFVEGLPEGRIPTDLEESEFMLVKLGVAPKTVRRTRQVLMKSARYAALLHGNQITMPDGWNVGDVPPIPLDELQPQHRYRSINGTPAAAFEMPKMLSPSMAVLAEEREWTEGDFQEWLRMVESAARFHLKLPRERSEHRD